MRLATVCVGEPAFMRDGTELVRTGICKTPALGPVRAGRLGLEGDGQADPDNHGGEFMAVYAYSADHYANWRAELGRDDLAHGQFGENLAIEGLAEARVCLGERWRIGSVELAVTQPRVPCFKLGLRMGDPAFVLRFSQSQRTGCYLRVLQEGSLQAGDPVTRIAPGDPEVPIDRLFAALMLEKGRAGAGLLARALENEHLSPAWRAAIRERLGRQLAP